MTIRLIVPYQNGAAGAQVDLDNATEASLVAQGMAVYVVNSGASFVPLTPAEQQNVRDQATIVSQLAPMAGTYAANKIAIIGNSLALQAAAPGNVYSGTGWDVGQSIAVNAITAPSYWDLRKGVAPIYWKCTTAGVTGALEPDWPHSGQAGQTVTDGTVVWTATDFAGSFVWYWNFGWWHVAQALSGQRLDEAIIVGRSGKQSDNVLQYVDRILAATDVGVVAFLGVFENDCWPGAAPVLTTITDRWNNFVVKADACRAAGKRVIVSTVFPNGSIDGSGLFTGYSFGTGSKAWLYLNNKLRDYAKARGDVILWDAASVYLDPNPANPVWPENTVTYLSATGAGQQLKKTDGIHPYTSGHWLLGQSLSSLLSANFQSRTIFTQALDTNNNAVNPLLFGTAGTNGTNGSGNVANSVTCSAFGTGTGTHTKVARTDISGSYQHSVYAMSVGDNAEVTWTSNQTPAFSAFEVVQGFFEAQVAANPTLMTFWAPRIRFNGATNQFSDVALAGDTTKQDFGQMVTSTTLLTLKTLPVIAPPSFTTVNTFNKVYGRGACTITIDFGRSGIMRKTQPATP